MNDEQGNLPPELPAADAPVEWLGFSLAADFYPAIKLARKTGLEFTAELSDILEPENVRLENDGWSVAGGGVCEGIQVAVEKRHIRILISPVSQQLERYEHKIQQILRAFEERFEPKVALQSNVDISGLVSLPGDTDARAFLGGYVMLMHPHKLDAIARPLDILGVRLRFPPAEGIDWSVDVRIESWGEDPKKVFLNADADWYHQIDWTEQYCEILSERISVISSFMSESLVRFLREPPFPGEDSDDE